MEGDWGNGVLLEKTFILVREKRKARESQQVEIIAHLSKQRLNYEWIEKYFKWSQLTISR